MMFVQNSLMIIWSICKCKNYINSFIDNSVSNNNKNKDEDEDELINFKSTPYNNKNKDEDDYFIDYISKYSNINIIKIVNCIEKISFSNNYGLYLQLFISFFIVIVVYSYNSTSKIKIKNINLCEKDCKYFWKSIFCCQRINSLNEKILKNYCLKVLEQMKEVNSPISTNSKLNNIKSDNNNNIAPILIIDENDIDKKNENKGDINNKNMNKNIKKNSHRNINYIKIEELESNKKNDLINNKIKKKIKKNKKNINLKEVNKQKNKNNSSLRNLKTTIFKNNLLKNKKNKKIEVHIIIKD